MANKTCRSIQEFVAGLGPTLLEDMSENPRYWVALVKRKIGSMQDMPKDEIVLQIQTAVAAVLGPEESDSNDNDSCNPAHSSPSSAPLSGFLQGLIVSGGVGSSSLACTDPSTSVIIVQDNCGSLSSRARQLLRLCYRGSSGGRADGSRWDSRPESRKTKKTNSNKGKSSTSNANKVQPLRPPLRTASLEAGADKWTYNAKPSKGDTIPHLPPRDPVARSKLRWALALDGKANKYDDDDDSSTDSESESASESELGISIFDDYETDSDSDDSDSDDSDSDYSSSDDEDDAAGDTSRWASDKIKVNAHDWELPPNAILPNMQELFRKAAQNRDFDINATMQALTLAARPI